MKRRESPAQVRARASIAFRQQQARAIDARVVATAPHAPAPMRFPTPGETPLSGPEIQHGIYHGVFAEPGIVQTSAPQEA